MQLELVPEYNGGFSGKAKARYCAKVCRVDLKLDPYVIPDELWMEKPDRVPNVQRSDMFMYMIVTSSAYSKEELKVNFVIRSNDNNNQMSFI